MHTHDAACSWVHRDYPQWQGCRYRIECTEPAQPVRMLGTHDTGRVFRLDVEVCQGHAPAMAEFAGATRFQVGA